MEYVLFSGYVSTAMPTEVNKKNIYWTDRLYY